MSAAPVVCNPMPFVPPALSKSSITSTSIAPAKSKTMTKSAPKPAMTETATGGYHGQHGRKDHAGDSKGSEEVQNAASRSILKEYFQHRLPNVPVDPRNGLDMRTLCAAQKPGYLSAQNGKTYESTDYARRPYYEGAIVDQLRDGPGKCVYGNTYFTYEGQWSKGRMNGQGRFMMQDGGFYEGSFVGGEITGSGIRQWADGSQFSGQFLDGEMHGEGILIRADGERYDGAFKRNQRWGAGALVMPNGAKYEGTWEEHRLSGHGVYEGADGCRYDGEWFNGNMDGVGDLREGCGDHYTGRFMAARKNGPGKFFHAASGISYNCEWLNDAPRVVPGALFAERRERLEWRPREKPPKPEAAEGEEASEEEEEEEEVPPPSLLDVLAEPIAPGGVFPAFLLRIVDPEGTWQDGEHGRLIELCAGVFEEVVPEPPVEGKEPADAEPEEGEEAAPPPSPQYKVYPTPPMTLKLVPPPRVQHQGLAGEEEGGEPAEAAAEPAEEGGEEGSEGEGNTEGLRPVYDFGRKYPPSFILDGLKLTGGMLIVEGLTLPEEVEAGEYRLKVSSKYQSPFAVVEPLYIAFTVG